MKNTKLIVLRGPSGSGKSTVAKAIRLEQLKNGKKIAYVEQDYFRRIVLKEKDIINGFNIELIKKTIILLLENGYDVIVEGIFDSRRYEEMFENLINYHTDNNYFFYFNISLEETLRRHKTKDCANEFGEIELRSWYRDKDFLKCVKEKILMEKSSLEEMIKFITKTINFT